MALIFPQATPRQLKQLAKQLQAQAAAVFGVPLTLAQAQELAARAVGHESFHVAQQHVPAGEGQSTLEAMARRYVPLWKDTEVPPYHRVNATPSWAIEGPSQLQGEMRFRDEDGIVYRYVAPEADADGSRPPPEYLLRKVQSLPVRSISVAPNTSPWARFCPSPFEHHLLAEGQLKEQIWAGQLGLKEGPNQEGLSGTPEEIVCGLVSGLKLMAHCLDWRSHSKSPYDASTLLEVSRALCWLRDESGQHLPLTRRQLINWMDYDRLSSLANIPELPQEVAGPLRRVLVPEVKGDLEVLRESLACVDLEGRDARLRAGRLSKARQERAPAPRRPRIR